MGSGDFRALVAEHKNKLFRMACWMLHDRSEAEDAVQEVFLKVWEKQIDHNNYGNLEAYLIEMTKNKCLNRIKSRKKLVNEDQLRYMKSPQTSADYDFETNDELKRIKDVIARLPENQRVVLQLKGVEGLEIREISKLLNETDNNVRVILSRARQTVRETYLKIYGYEPG
jgi:RNA polymerase sigma factor (sigma-70 family)